ncbi:hypothetical protein AA0117_g12091 [Alternaria alternata]|uniref:Uncharacterized protein n=1 Tax=Alternaria alternata TaxID=5599 RepID=A0A4Q4N1B5_ALTAL|nr:hypothetical protein AA0117_g12091 [Alternaria alternata]
MIDAVEHQCCKVVEQKDKKMIDPQEITSATYPLKGISSYSVASAASQFPISHLATGSWTSGDQTTLSDSSLGVDVTSNSPWPILTPDNITATSRTFDYRDLSGNSISLSSFAYESNIRDEIVWSNRGPSTSHDFMAHLSQKSTGLFTEISTPQFATAITSIILRMFPKTGSSASIVLLGDSSAFESAISSVSDPSTSQLIRQLGIDHQFIYMIFQRLVNDGNSAQALDKPQTKLDHFFKIGITYCFSLGEEVLVNIINTTPPPYSLSLMQNMFCAALVLGNGAVLRTILMLDRESFVNRPVLLGDVQYYPLEYTSLEKHVQATQVLLDHGADPNRQKNESSLERIGRISQVRDENMNAKVQIMRMLIDHGLDFEPNFDWYRSLQYNKDMFSMLFTYCLNKSFQIFFRHRALPKVLLHPGWDDSFSQTLRSILDQAYLEIDGCQDLWNSVLTEALSSAAKCNHMPAVDMLLAMGAIPDVHCLISAAQGNDSKIFEEFLHRGLDPNAGAELIDDVIVHMHYQRDYGRDCDSTALSEAIKNRSRGALHILQAQDSISSSVNRPVGFASAVVAACEVGDSTLVEQLLSLPKLPRGEPRLEMAMEGAVEGNHYHIAKLLLSVGIKPSIRSLELAVRKKRLAFVKLLASCMNLPESLEASRGYYESASKGTKEPYHSGVIIEALRWGDQTAIDYILETGHPVDGTYRVYGSSMQDWDLGQNPQPFSGSVDLWVLTPLSAAILKGNLIATKALMAHGAHPGLRSSQLTSHQSRSLKRAFQPEDAWAITTLAACAIRGNLDLIKDLLGEGLDPFDNSALYVSAVLDSEETIILLLSAFKNRYPNGAQSFGSDALYRSAHSALDLLLPLVKNLNAVVRMDHKHYHMTALLYTISLGSLETVQKLHKAGADISLPTKGLVTRTPLQAAAEAGSKEITQYLLGQGASPNELPANRAGATALQLAAIKGNIGVATILLDAGADINAQPALCDGRTAFEGAAEYGRIEMMIFLVQQGADLLSNNGEQYRRAIAFADDNLQHAAKKLAEDLHQQVSVSPVTNFIGMGQNEWPETDVNGLGDFVF